MFNLLDTPGHRDFSDRPSPGALEILDDIEQTLGIEPTPVTWPVKPANRFVGVVDRRDGTFHRYGASTRAGAQRPDKDLAAWSHVHDEWPDAAEEVGQLQFDVAAWRMEHEFRSPIRFESCGYSLARRTDEASAPRLGTMRNVAVYRRASGTPLALFDNQWQLERIQRDHPELTLDVIVTG